MYLQLTIYIYMCVGLQELLSMKINWTNPLTTTPLYNFLSIVKLLFIIYLQIYAVFNF